jgi:hypothetical protein
MQDISRVYVELAHGINDHLPGYIDGYYGPEEWKPSEARSLDELAQGVEGLRQAVENLAGDERRVFLEAQARAMSASIDLLRGESIPYAEEVRLLYDIEIAYVPDQQFDEAIGLLDDLLPLATAEEPDLASREQAFRRQFVVDVERLPRLLDVIMAEFASRTGECFDLPEGESFEVRLVTGKPWSGYNWYSGNYHSIIEINVDLPVYITGLPDLVAHEGYPGHHTEHAIKERRLFQDAGRGEHSILLINAPECVISEGIATHARSIVMSDQEMRDWLVDDLLELAGLSGVDTDRMLVINSARKALRAVTGNAAWLLHVEGRPEEEVLAYLQRYRLATPAEAEKSLQFISHPNFRSYIYTYTAGEELLANLFAVEDRNHWFRRLLAEPLTPGALRVASARSL